MGLIVNPYDKMDSIQCPHEVTMALFDFLGALTNEDVGTILSRWEGMTNERATEINKALTALYKNMMNNGASHRFRPKTGDPHSWLISEKHGWNQAKPGRDS